MCKPRVSPGKPRGVAVRQHERLWTRKRSKPFRVVRNGGRNGGRNDGTLDTKFCSVVMLTMI